MHLQTMHLIPEALGGMRILAQKEVGELRQDDPGGIWPERPGDAADPLVGRDLQELLRGAEMPIVDLLAPGGAPGIASMLR